MRTVTFNVYTFDELSENAKNKAIEDNSTHIANMLRENDNQEYNNTLKMLEQATNTKVQDYELSDRYRPYFKIHVNTGWNEKDADEITGKHLFRKVYRELIYKFQTKKTYYKKDKKRNSRIITIEGNSWPITGTWTEDRFENTIKNYYQNWNKFPKNYSLQNLMKDCWGAFFTQWQNDLEYHYEHKDEIIEHMQINDYEFKEDGTTYYGAD